MTHVLTQHHVTASIEDDGTLLIEQVDHSGNREAVCLHTSQLRAIAEHVGLLKSSPMVDMPAGLRTRLERIQEDADKLYQLLASVPTFPPSARETEDVSAAYRLYCDIDDLLADYFETEQISDNESPDVSNVVTSTVNTKKPSPPAHGDNDGQLF